MRGKTLVIMAAALSVLLLSGGVAADPLPEVIPVTESVTLRADGGAELRVPPGYYVPLDAWQALDAEIKRSQTAETRLSAENLSLRKSAESESCPWYLIAGAFALGITLGTTVF